MEVIAEQIESIVQESPRRRSENYGELPPRVLAALEAHGTHGATAATLAAAVDAPRKQVWASLERLVKQGTAAKQGTTYVVTKGAA